MIKKITAAAVTYATRRQPGTHGIVKLSHLHGPVRHERVLFLTDQSRYKTVEVFPPQMSVSPCVSDYAASTHPKIKDIMAQDDGLRTDTAVQQKR